MTSIKRAEHSNWLLGIVAALALAALGLAFGVGAKQISDDHARQSQQNTAQRALSAQLSNELQCIENWASATASSNATVRNASNARNDALDSETHALNALLRAAILRRPPASLSVLASRWLEGAAHFDRATAVYRAALKAHPVLTPNLRCEGTLKPVAAPSTVRVTVHPPEPTRTTVHVPGPTLTRIVPGPTVTRTVCRKPNGRTC